ncbi:MAG: hypothetical protein RMJ56_01750 [Gemmataceae bacterium]|nr:hypothetical protein [Gemmata sp.]MDW8196307.1 hypothetical protein [Gemmataceae bacterium]
MRHRPALDLFVISWLVLFLELACIRWFPSHVLFLTFFVNLVLLACFVGMSIGCLVARRPTNLIRQTPIWLLIGIVLGLTIDYFAPYLMPVFKVGNQANPEVVYFGTETSIILNNPLPFTIPMEFVGALFFAIIAAILVGPGQEMGRAFNRVPSRTTAYSANLLGSLLGIGTFAICSMERWPPLVWFALVGIVITYLLVRPDPDATAEVREALPPSVTGVTASAAPHFPPSPPPPVSPLVPLGCLVVAIALTATTSGLVSSRGLQTIWSEYYRIDYDAKRRFIITNLISHQLMEPRSEPPVADVPYALPYLFQRDLKKPDGSPAWPEFRKVLIIGAGNGNDVSRALMFLKNDTRVQIDAVEIDPVIQRLGELHHPDRPFQDPRVHVHINDGRNFLRQAPSETYDLVVFALIDSLVLQSGYSNLRLESYLFTRECFQDVKRVLKPTGVYAVYNFFRQGWITARIRDQLQAAFDGVEPVAITTPPLAYVPLDKFFPTTSTCFFGGRADVIEPLRQAFAPHNGQPVKYWYPWYTGVTADTQARFGTEPPAQPPPPSPTPVYRVRYVKDAEGNNTFEFARDPTTGEPIVDEFEPQWLGLYPARIEASDPALRPATDDWPFLYARYPRIPSQTASSMALIFGLSVLLWWVYGGRQALATEAGIAPDYGSMLRAFFLGAGFMLVETKAVVEMALLFGGTWMVNTAVFAAILVMSLAGNLFAGWVKPRRLEPYYAGLFVALAIGLIVSPSAFLGYNPTVQIVGACLLVFVPIAFAGVIFATSFRRTGQPDRVFGANVAGALVGGLAENTSILLGFQLLLCVAIGFYLLSALFANQELPTRAADSGV